MFPEEMGHQNQNAGPFFSLDLNIACTNQTQLPKMELKIFLW